MLKKKKNVCCLFRVTEDILYFKKIELRTKMGRRGRILEPLGKSTSECRLACRWFTTGRFGPEAQPAADSSTVGNPGCFTGYPGCSATRMTPHSVISACCDVATVCTKPRLSPHYKALCPYVCVFQVLTATSSVTSTAVLFPRTCQCTCTNLHTCVCHRHSWPYEVSSQRQSYFPEHFNAPVIIIIICPLTARVVGAPKMILQPVSSIFSCSPLPSGSWRTPGLSIP